MVCYYTAGMQRDGMRFEGPPIGDKQLRRLFRAQDVTVSSYRNQIVLAAADSFTTCGACLAARVVAVAMTPPKILWAEAVPIARVRSPNRCEYLLRFQTSREAHGKAKYQPRKKGW